MKFQTYEKYKPSGVEWLGDIPERWEVKRLKDDSAIFNGSTPKSNNSFFWNGDIVWVTPKDISRNLLVKNSEKKITIEGYESCGTTLMPPKTIIMTTRAPIGNISITEVYSCTNQGCKSIYSKIINYKFLFFYLYAGILKIQSLGCGTTFFELSTKELNSFCLLKPNKQTQTQIANYLDKKTALIDKKIEFLEKKKGKYQEFKQTLINEVVTKGLDKNVEMKESGIEWIGKIPKHWEVKRLKDIGNISTSSINKKIIDEEDLVKLINYTDVYSNFSKELKNNEKWMVVSANKNQIRKNKLKKGDILFTPSSETIEDIGVSAVVIENLKNTLYSYHLVRLRCVLDIHNRFKKYLFNNSFVQYYFSKSAKGTTRQILGLNVFDNLKIPFPFGRKEQITIANYLDEKTQKIDIITKTIDKNIEVLKEFRKTLINDVVTGKVKVV